MNSNLLVSCGILCIVVCTSAEVKLGAHVLNIKEGEILHLALTELGHRQTPTSVLCDNRTTAGIVNDSVKIAITLDGNTIILGDGSSHEWKI